MGDDPPKTAGIQRRSAKSAHQNNASTAFVISNLLLNIIETLQNFWALSADISIRAGLPIAICHNSAFRLPMIDPDRLQSDRLAVRGVVAGAFVNVAPVAMILVLSWGMLQ